MFEPTSSETPSYADSVSEALRTLEPHRIRQLCLVFLGIEHLQVPKKAQKFATECKSQRRFWTQLLATAALLKPDAIHIYASRIEIATWRKNSDDEKHID